MPTAQELTKLRDALITARLSGVREVRDSNGESVRYATDPEMVNAIRDVNRLIQDLDRTPTSTIRFRTSKGLDR